MLRNQTAEMTKVEQERARDHRWGQDWFHLLKPTIGPRVWPRFEEPDSETNSPTALYQISTERC